MIKKGLRALAVLAVAGAAFSCGLSESERVPEVLEITCNENPSALETSIVVKVKCDLNWTPSLLDDSWGSVEVTEVVEGSGGSFTLKMGVNQSEQMRENTLVVKAGKSEVLKTIRQGGLGTFFQPRSVQLTGTAEEAVSFTSPVAWTARVAAANASWLTLDKTSGEKGASRLGISALDGNENVGAREGKVQITIGANTFDILVTQGQTDVILTEDTQLNFPFEEQEFSVRTRFNVEYTVEVSAPWIRHVSAKAPLYEGTERFVLEENAVSQDRSGQIRFSGGDASLVLTVNQEGMDPILNITQPGFYGIDGVNYVMGEGGWNQSSRMVSSEGFMRYRLLDGSTLSVVEASGSGTSFHVSLKTKDKVLFIKDYPVTLFYEKDGLVWYKESADTYFIIQK